MRALWIAALLAATSTSAWAGADLTKTSDGYTYFNKPGASAAQHDADLRDCRIIATATHQPISTPGTAMYVPAGTSPVAAGIGGAIGMAIVMGIEQKAADHKGRPVNVENCMVVKGWRVVALDEAEGKAVDALDDLAKAAKVDGWVGAAEPHGTMVRAFANDAAEDKLALMFSPATLQGTSLSDAVTAKVKDRSRVATPAKAPPGKPAKALADADLGGVPAGAGLMVVNVKGDAEIEVVLDRISGPQAGAKDPLRVAVSRPAKAFANKGAVAGATYAYAVPPGRWRLMRVTVNGMAMSFCLGAPVFDIAAGEAVYAGSFDADHLNPDMDLATGKAMFPGLSTVPDLLKPAAWINGTVSACEGAYIYALEAPGRPFEDGYAMGSKALNAAAKPAQAAAPAAAASSTR